MKANAPSLSTEANEPVHCIIPAVLLAVLCLGFLWFVVSTASALPERVATHFGLSGIPDGWMSRAEAIGLMAATGVGLPLFIVGLAAVIRFLPASLINIPHRDYWLAPNRRARTSALMFRLMLWLSCLLVAFMAGLHFLTLRANQTNPAQMPTDLLLIILAGYLAALGFWIFRLVRTFSKPAIGT
jgi:uncharacterized membrane protein